MIAATPLGKIQTKIHNVTVFNTTKTRRDRKILTADLKSVSQNWIKVAEKSLDTSDNFLLF